MKKKNLITYKVAKRLIRYLCIFWDAIRGLDFLIVKEPEQLGYDRSRINRASPSGNAYLLAALNDIGITKETKILDIGCAKGDALRVFTKFPFSKVSGIEVSSELADVAINNFAKLKKKVEIINIDATKFSSYDEFNFFYLYNPFPSKEILHNVLKKILDCCASYEISVLYNNPNYVDVFLENGFKIKNIYDDEWGNGMLFMVRPAHKTTT